LTGRILYKSSVGRDLKKISSKDKERILRQIRTTLGENPRVGEPLHGEFEGLFKLRVGDYRVIYALSGQDVLVLRVRNRGKAYG
jgi:mRNA interferase RelE/StbE